ncbi:uncharacterized protein LOC116160392 [Photinus pyralis]|uniref:uncharacterized protein LOC116160392 n=1 Tax=Photinus pyralis TaxID=7054 RepID=UPI0012674DB1|nr:uncharacterized protein LOC116160392 [Photinus pyralis]
MSLPNNVVETILKSLSEATVKQYGATYKRWLPFCADRGVNPYEGTPSLVMSFLQHLFDTEENAYGTFNSHRSALSLITSTDLSSHPVLCRFLKGIAKLRPSRPRYNVVWDPQVVLAYLERLAMDSLKALSEKLITLLALTTAHRIQTFSLIRIENIIESGNGFQILIEDKIKTSGIGRTQPCLHLPYFTENPKLCVATALKQYLTATKGRRTSVRDFLFLTYKKPYRTASKQSLSRWVKDTLEEAGIDTRIFKAHSTRHASTSKAFDLGVPLEVIRQTAGWSTNSKTFCQFYNRPISQVGTLSKAILSL